VKYQSHLLKKVMATVTEKDIISHLKEKIRFHQQEEKKIENLLAAFTGSSGREEPVRVKSKQRKTAGSQRTGRQKAAPLSIDEVESILEESNAGQQPAAKRSGAASKRSGSGRKTPINAGKTEANGSKSASKSKAKSGKNADNQPGADSASSNSGNTSSKVMNIPEAYDEHMTINAKIAFALNEIGEGYNEDIANTMAMYEPRSDAKRLGKQISGVLSTLKNKGYLNAKREGRKDKFSLVS
jgi:hypothetical protein